MNAEVQGKYKMVVVVQCDAVIDYLCHQLYACCKARLSSVSTVFCMSPSCPDLHTVTVHCIDNC